VIGNSLGRPTCTTLLLLGVFAAACGAGSGSHAITGTASGLPGATVSVKSEFAGSETFCASKPLSGTITYEVAAGEARMALGVGGLPASSTVLINWLNNPIRGYVIGVFRTNSAGLSVTSSTRLYRPGETRGHEIRLTSSDAQGTVLGVLRPCG
jgi:hypothetical protein